MARPGSVQPRGFRFADRLIPLKSPLLTEQAGHEFAAQGEVTAEPRTQLDAPLMSAAEYVQFLGM